MSAVTAFIMVAPFEEKVFLMTTLRALEAIGPPHLKEVVLAILFCLEAFHEVDKIHFFLLHSLNLSLFQIYIQIIITKIAAGNNLIVMLIYFMV
jgi:ABC-type transport system involved in multi-copper enzyme maturation permease subunit